MSPIPYARSCSPVLTPLVVVSSSSQQTAQVTVPIASIATIGAHQHGVSSGHSYPSVSAVIPKPQKGQHNDEYLTAYDTLMSVIRIVAFNIDDEIAGHLKHKLMAGTLDKKDLFLASHLLKETVPNTSAAKFISNCIEAIFNGCTTDQQKEEVLIWVPDSIKFKFRIMQYLHADHYKNITSLIDGSLPIPLVQETFKILCLYTSRKHACAVLCKYKTYMPVDEFDCLSLFINRTFEMRTRGLFSVINHVQSSCNKSLDVDLMLMDNADNKCTVPTTPAKEFIESVRGKEKIRRCCKKNISKKQPKKPCTKVEEIRKKLLDGSVPIGDILSSREFLLQNKVPIAQVSRWFRMYRDKVLKSPSASCEDTQKILDELEASKRACKKIAREGSLLSPEVFNLIERIKFGGVALHELKNIKNILVDAVGSERSDKLFASLKVKMLEQHPECEPEITRAFLSVRQRKLHDLTESEELLIKAISDATLPVTKLRESIEVLVGIRSPCVVRPMICDYVEKLIYSGIQPDLILSNLQPRFRSLERVMKACSIEDFVTVQALKHGTLPFADLERSANIASKYFSPYVLFGILLRYAYKGRTLSLIEQESFKSLLASLEAEGVIVASRHAGQMQSGSGESCTNVGPSGVLDMFDSPEAENSLQRDCMGLQSVTFEHLLADMMVRSGVDLELEDVLEFDLNDSDMSCVGLLSDIALEPKELLGNFQD